ncbi:MAG: hypothetical protein JSV44_02665, partial [Candidatus Zixiibacteriota bacterium]
IFDSPSATIRLENEEGSPFHWNLSVNQSTFYISAGDNTSSWSRMIIDSTGDVNLAPTGGKVKLGTGSIESKLHVLADHDDNHEVARFEDAMGYSEPYISLWISNTLEAARIEAANDVSEGASLRLYTTAPPEGTAYERLRIASSGEVGIGTTAPHSSLHVNGSMAVGITTVSSDVSYTATASDCVILASGTVTNIDLPQAGEVTGRTYVIKSIGGNFVSITPYGGELIENQVTTGVNPLQSIMIVSDGNAWWILADK